MAILAKVEVVAPLGRQRLRVACRAIGLVGLCAALGMLANKAAWGFFVSPSSIRFGPGSTPEAIARFENAGVDPDEVRWSNLEQEQNAYIKSAIERCSSDPAAFADCTFGRILVRNGGGAWLVASSLEPTQREEQLRRAFRCLQVEGVVDEAPFWGILGKARSEEGASWEFISAETTKKRPSGMGEFRHLECAWRADEPEGPFLWETYRYDIAGVEFLTPFVMACAFLVPALFIWATWSVLRRSREGRDENGGTQVTVDR